jgi:hypothetical protein
MSTISYRGYGFPPEIIQHTVWLYLRFTLSFRDIDEVRSLSGAIRFASHRNSSAHDGRQRGGQGLRHVGLTLRRHPIAFLRDDLLARRIVTWTEPCRRDGRWLEAAGRAHPAASGQC